MKLGPKARNLLEILAALSADAAEALLGHRDFYRMVGCCSRDSLRERLRLAEGNGWIVWDDSRESGRWVAKLTQAGRAAISQGPDPNALWSEAWDGKWRLLVFDLPSYAHKERRALRGWLKELRFGRIQGSAYLSPRTLGDWESELSRLKVDPRAVVFMNGDFGGANRHRHYVEQAWDFKRINQSYARYLRFASEDPPRQLDADTLACWLGRECSLWREAIKEDPFLPQELWPSGFRKSYLGPKAWASRCRLRTRFDQQLLAAVDQIQNP